MTAYTATDSSATATRMKGKDMMVARQASQEPWALQRSVIFF